MFWDLTNFFLDSITKSRVCWIVVLKMQPNLLWNKSWCVAWCSQWKSCVLVHRLMQPKKAENTCKKYKYAFNVFCKWCSSFEPWLVPLPATESTIAAYLISLILQLKFKEAVYSINWAHSFGGFQNPCDSTLVRSVKEGARWERLNAENTERNTHHGCVSVP